MAEIDVKPIETPFLHGIPAPNGVKSPHAITTHLDGWKDIMNFVNKDPAFFGSFVDMYPRLILHKDVKKVRCTP
jgi:cystathionine gamma-synthase